MPVHFEWADEAAGILRGEAAGAWNWNDFHKHARRSTLLLDRSPAPIIDLIIHFSQLPAGAFSHLRSLATPLSALAHPKRAPRTVLIGIPVEVQMRLGEVEGVATIGEHLLAFVSDERAALTKIAVWRERDSG